MRWIVIALVSLMVASAAASAQNENKPDINLGNFFLQFCENADSPASGVLFYVQGFSHGMLLQSSGRELPLCIPTGVTYGQQARVVCHYLKDNPAETHRPIGILLARAYSKAWPCEAP